MLSAATRSFPSQPATIKSIRSNIINLRNFSRISINNQYSSRRCLSNFNKSIFNKIMIRNLSTSRINRDSLQDSTVEKIKAMEVDDFRDLYVANPELWKQVEAQVSPNSNGNDNSTDEVDVPTPTKQQMKLYFLGNFLPFLGFGFFDNALMLVFGDLFDCYLGASLGISTLAAAAMGNIVGDVSGIWLGGTVEYFVGKNIKDHMLTSKQMRLTKVQTMKTIAMTSGIFIGCILGMFPLIWPEEYRLWSDSKADDVDANGELVQSPLMKTISSKIK